MTLSLGPGFWTEDTDWLGKLSKCPILQLRQKCPISFEKNDPFLDPNPERNPKSTIGNQTRSRIQDPES